MRAELKSVVLMVFGQAYAVLVGTFMMLLFHVGNLDIIQDVRCIFNYANRV